MKEFLKEHWFIITFVAAPLMTGLVFLFSLNSRIFNSPEQKVRHEDHVNQSLTPVQQFQRFSTDTANANSAVRARAVRLERERRKDSVNAIQDSIMLDYVQKNAEQIYQIKEIINQE